MSSFVGNVGRVLQGTAVAQAIGMLVLPVLSRLYPPAAFGHLQFFATTLSLALVAVTLRYEVAILQAASQDDAKALVRLCIWINGATALLSAIVCFTLLTFFGPWGVGTRTVLWLLTPGIALAGLLQTLGYLPLRLKDFRVGAGAKVVQAVAYAALALGTGLVLPSAVGLTVADLSARGVAAALIWWWCARHGISLSGRVARGALKAAAWAHREMPRYAVPGGIINTAGGVLTPIMMYATFDASTLGQYALVERSLMLPVGMVAVAVSQVFSADLAEQLRGGSGAANQSFRRVVASMARIGLVPAFVVGLAAPWLFPRLFGAQWAAAGEYAQLLAPLLFASFVTAPVNMAIMLAGRQRMQMAWEVCRLLTIAAAWVAVSLWNLGPHTAIALHVASGVCMCLLYLTMADRVLADAHQARPLRDHTDSED